jgi:hypothetical protein
MTIKRKPQKAPGSALLSDNPVDLHLCPSLYYDSVYFLFQAKLTNLDYNISARYRRASLYSSFSFFEALLNQVAFAHAAAHKSKLTEIELDILEEKTSILDDNAHIVRKEKYYNMEDRFLFVYRFLTGKDFDKNTKLWSDFKIVRKIRNEWTHPKPPLDKNSLHIKDVELTIKTIYSIFTKLSTEMNIENPAWLINYQVLIKIYEEKENI